MIVAAPGIPPIFASTQLYVAEREGLFKKHGANIEIRPFETGTAAADGTFTIAGYGTGSRLEYLLIPLVFGLGGPLVALVGTAIGAGERKRALRTDCAV